MPEGIFIDYLCSYIFLLNNKSNEKNLSICSLWSPSLLPVAETKVTW